MKTENVLNLAFIFTFLAGLAVDFVFALYLTVWVFIAIKFIQLRKENKL